MRSLILALLFLVPAIALAADPLEVEGVKLGASRTEVLKHEGASAKGDGVALTAGNGGAVEVSFDGKGRAKRIYAAYRKGLLPIKDFTQKYGEPVKQDEGNSTKYVFKVAGQGTLVLEKVRGYPGYYVEALR